MRPSTHYFPIQKPYFRLQTLVDGVFFSIETRQLLELHSNLVIFDRKISNRPLQGEIVHRDIDCSQLYRGIKRNTIKKVNLQICHNKDIPASDTIR